MSQQTNPTTGFATPTTHTPTGFTAPTQPEIPSVFMQSQIGHQAYPAYAVPQSVPHPQAPHIYQPHAIGWGTTGYLQPAPGPAPMFAPAYQGPTAAGFVGNRQAPTNDLGEGYSYENVAFISKARRSPQETILANTLDAGWKPAGSGHKFPQRCPAIWVDNITVVFQRGMNEPMIALALWSKDGVVCFGKTTKLSGLVSVGGGHYEAMGDKSCNGTYTNTKFEAGHISARVAADTELNEEVGIRPENIHHTRILAVEDDALGDQRKQGVRIIYGRWVEQSELKPSKELTRIVLIPLSQIGRLIAGEQYRIDGVAYSMILGHDKMLERVFRLPQWTTFLGEVARFAQTAIACQPAMAQVIA